MTSPFDNLRPELRDALDKRGIVEPTTVQNAVLAIDALTSNLRISSQTGSGKTVAIGLALAGELAEPVEAGAGPRVIILAPTRELAAQVADELKWLYEVLKIRVGAVTGGTDFARERRALKSPPPVLVATPGRLLDHLRQGNVTGGAVRHVVLDEADRMLDMGFREELEGIFEMLPKERRNHLISATFPGHVLRFADRFQGESVHVQGTRLGEANEDIDHVAHLVRPHERYAALVNLLLMAREERCLVFVRKRTDAAEIAEQLATDGFSAMPLSGDLPQAQRSRTLLAFRTGAVPTLIATDVAARGIDVEGIYAVIHFELPTDGDQYTHRSGRTGRAGKRGRSVLLVPPQGEMRVRQVLRRAGAEATWTAAPGVSAVKEASVARVREALQALFESDHQPRVEHRDHARELLGRLDPELLVAHLLERCEPTLPCPPQDISPIEPKRRAQAEDTRARSGPRVQGKFLRFYINWGEKKGATPGRVLALVCRRGGISSKHVGSVQIDARWTKLEIAEEVAESFEAAVAQPDERDPHIRVRRWQEKNEEPPQPGATRKRADKPRIKPRKPRGRSQKRKPSASRPSA